MLPTTHRDMDNSMDKVSNLPYMEHMDIKSMDTQKDMSLLSVHKPNHPHL